MRLALSDSCLHQGFQVKIGVAKLSKSYQRRDRFLRSPSHQVHLQSKTKWCDCVHCVSTDLQEREHTVLSQLEALRTYLKERGYVLIAEYVDEGFSGATLDRPGLDRLRDALRAGDMDLVVFHSPDRLARKAVYQGLVLEEMEKAGVRAEFLNYPVDDSPESKMLLGMQGLFAEYERAKIMERTRRGKLHRAREGALVGGHAPFGYRWPNRRPGLQPFDSLRLFGVRSLTMRRKGPTGKLHLPRRHNLAGVY